MNRESIRECGGLEVLAHLLRTPILPKSEPISQSGNSDTESSQNGKANDEASLLSSVVWAVEALSVNGTPPSLSIHPTNCVYNRPE